jgi:hypothetical protein
MTRSPDRTFQAAAREALLTEIDGDRSRAHRGSRHRSEASRQIMRTGLGLLIAGTTVAAGWLGVVAVQGRARQVEPPAATRPAPTSTPSPTPSDRTGVTDDQMRALINQVTGTGTLTGPITGDFTITHEYGSPVLHLTNVDVGSSDARTVLVAVDLASATCTAEKVGTTAGTITAKPRQTVSLQDSSPQTFSDLSYMKALAIWPEDMGCVAGEVSAGTIRWRLPARLRELAKTDLGPVPAARGHVTVTDDRPTRYRVASNDSISAVAARFDLTANELLYLNPLRDHGNDDQLFAGETLNLDPLDRAYFSNTGF